MSQRGVGQRGLVRRVAVLLGRKDLERAGLASERFALSMLGYSLASARGIEVAQVRPPVSDLVEGRDARPAG